MRTILWDLDGTIADTEELHFRAWHATMADYGVTYAYEQFLAGFGKRNGEILPELLGVEPGATLVEEVAQRKEATFRELLFDSDLQALPGVVDWLAHFEQKGVQQVVSSSGPMANIAAIVNKLSVADYFVSLMSGAKLPKGKPDPAIFLNSAAAVAAPPATCLVIEDSIHGITAARRAGMAAVAVGNLAQDAALPALLSTTTGPDILALARLDALTWDTCERLWASAVQGGRQDAGAPNVKTPVRGCSNPRRARPRPTFTTRDGYRLHARLIRPEDASLLIELFEKLSPATRRRRFHADFDRINQEIKQETAWELANVDNRTQGGAVLAIDLDKEGAEHIVGVARLARPLDQPDAPEAEAAIVVRDDFQGRGVGTELLQRLVRLAKQMQLKTIVATIEADNSAAIKIFRELGLPAETHTSQAETEMRIAVPE